MIAARDLVPHTGDAVLIDQVSAADPGVTTATATVRGCAPFGEDGADWPAWLCIEVMAQTVAAAAGAREFRPGVRPRLGLLLGVRHFRCDVDTVPEGSPVVVEARESSRNDDGTGVFDCVLRVAGSAVATATLAVYLPDSVEDYLGSLAP